MSSGVLKRPMKLNFVPVHFSTSCLYDYLMSHSARMIFCLNMLIAIFFHSSLLNSTDKIGRLMFLSPLSLTLREWATRVKRGTFFPQYLIPLTYTGIWDPTSIQKAYVRVNSKVKMR